MLQNAGLQWVQTEYKRPGYMNRMFDSVAAVRFANADNPLVGRDSYNATRGSCFNAHAPAQWSFHGHRHRVNFHINDFHVRYPPVAAADHLPGSKFFPKAWKKSDSIRWCVKIIAHRKAAACLVIWSLDRSSIWPS